MFETVITCCKFKIIAALPKLIKLNPVVVREVFNRLLGVHGESNITPTELLVALHTLDNTKADLKTVMKATSMCLSEKQVSIKLHTSPH